MKKNLVLVAMLLIAASVTQSLSAADVYLARRTDTSTGTGTQSDPFDVSTTARFDSVMASIPEFSFVHIGAGNFTTTGRLVSADSTNPNAPANLNGWLVKNGWTIQGAGMDRTVIKLADHTPATPFVVCGEYGQSDYNMYQDVADVTIDANATLQNGRPVGGIQLAGMRTRIERVKVINSGGTSGGETFSMLSRNFSTASFHIIRDCILDSPAPSQGTSGIGLWASDGGGIIEGCTVYGDGSSDLSAIAPAGSFSRGLSVRNNTTHRCRLGFHFDSTVNNVQVQGLQITDNHFLECFGIGVHLNGTASYNTGNEMRGIRVEGNEITVTAAATAGGINSEGGVSRSIFRSNLIRRADLTATTGCVGINFVDNQSRPSRNNFFEDNRCDVGMSHNLLASHGFGRDNLDLNGMPFRNAPYASVPSVYTLPAENGPGTPSITKGTDAATATLDPDADDRGMTITIQANSNANAAPSEPGIPPRSSMASVHYGIPYTTTSHVVSSPSGGGAVGMTLPTVSSGPTGFTVYRSAALDPGQVYSWNFVVSGH